MKRGQQFTMTTIGVMVLIVIVIAVLVIIFVQQTTKSGSKLGNFTESASVDLTKCNNVFLGRQCYPKGCPDDFKPAEGAFRDCPPGRCCVPK